jgi:hypothetical protein
MSDIAIDTLVETTISSSPTIWSSTTPARPIFPTSDETIVELHQDNPIAILNIAKGLATTIRKKEEQSASATLTFAKKISDLEKQLDDYREAVSLPTSNQPEGYVINDNTRVPSFVIPIGDGDHQQAYWVKQLVEGQVVGLP